MVTSPGFLRFSKIILVWVFLVIIAGAVVRMTQSGMGCPDWPKCFGKWVPPTNASELPADFEKYLKQQDIDHTFNVYHTWVEYINRLLGALLGLLLLAQLAWAIKLFWKSNRKIVWVSAGTVLLTGFQGWLGKKVVDANLATAKITTHIALLIAGLALTIVYLQQAKNNSTNKKLSNATLLAIALLTVQIIIGTDVREQIDVISKQLNYTGREQWIEKLDVSFYIHRSFSLVIAALCIYVFVQCKKAGLHLFSSKLILFCVLAEIGAGVVMAYFNVPALAQPIHLLLSAVLFVSLYNNWLYSSVATNSKNV
jgi:cytochrome c oxidase assembly protein subunit 15